MQLTIVVTTLLATAVSARRFILFDDINYGGQGNLEQQPNEARCWNLNGRGDKASSVQGDSGCTTFFRERDCRGASWQQRGDAPTVPTFLDNHIWSFANSC
ncbi:hypothetical protein QIS74_04275 [Colletotrichum tabaci]|uniref:Uncharacterized protein n=1 Tax=Colletotrichum tabaci TaxID=1209068 RepID=A0AAV9TJ90_9PEZI